MQPNKIDRRARTDLNTDSAAYGKTFGRASKGAGAFGIFLGASAIFAVKNPLGSPILIFELVCGIVFVAAIFWGIGFAFACLFAPRNYLEGEEGQARLAKIGTNNIIGAKIACASYLLFISAVVGFIVLCLIR